MKNAEQILVRPVVSEKSYALMEDGAYIFVVFVKSAIGYDDALDTFGIHAIGGTLGAIMTGILAEPAKFGDGSPNPEAVNPNLSANIDVFIVVLMIVIDMEAIRIEAANVYLIFVTILVNCFFATRTVVKIFIVFVVALCPLSPITVSASF